MTKRQEAIKETDASAIAKTPPLDLARMIIGYPARKAFDLILEHPEPEKVVPVLPLQDLYLMVKEIGPEDAIILLELSTSQQFQGIMDLECWRKDQLTRKPTVKWFTLIHEMGDERFITQLKAMDLSLITLFIKRYMSMQKIEELSNEIPDEEPDAFLTPDGRYLLRFFGTDDERSLILDLLQRIFRVDFEFFQLLTEAVYWELPADLEESAYQERTSRLAVRGFPEYYESLQIRHYVEPDGFVPHQKAAPALLTEPTSLSEERYLTRFRHRDSLLMRALAAGFPGRDAAISEIMALTNMATIVEQIDLADLEGVRDIVHRVDGFLNLGVWHLAGDNLIEACRILSESVMLEIYNLGRSLVIKERQRTKKILPKITANGRSLDTLLVDPRDQEMIFGLLEPEPVFILSSGERRNFSEPGQLVAVRSRLDQISFLSSIMHDKLNLTAKELGAVDLTNCNLDDLSALTWMALFNTVLASDLLGKPVALEPLSKPDLANLPQFLNKKQVTLKAEVIQKIDQWAQNTAGDRFSELIVAVKPWLEELTRELALFDQPEAPDPRFLNSILIKIK